MKIVYKKLLLNVALVFAFTVILYVLQSINLILSGLPALFFPITMVLLSIFQDDRFSALYKSHLYAAFLSALIIVWFINALIKAIKNPQPPTKIRSIPTIIFWSCLLGFIVTFALLSWMGANSPSDSEIGFAFAFYAPLFFIVSSVLAFIIIFIYDKYKNF